MTELALADVGYNDTIMFRPSFLRDAGRPESSAMATIARSENFSLLTTGY